MLIWLEIKQYLLAYRRVLLGLVSAAGVCALALAAVDTIMARQSLFEPFTVGVVGADDAPEIRMLFDFLSETAIELTYMDKSEAEAALRTGAIPAYVELPPRFAQDIISGENTPFVLHGNRDLPLQWALARLMAAGGVAFLSASQAGIYATVDAARAQGLDWDVINRHILFPINVAFINHMLRYDAFFAPETLPITEGHSPAAHYAFGFTAFLLMLLGLTFVRSLTRYTPAVYARFRLAGWGAAKVQGIRLAGLLAAYTLLTLPLYGLAVYVTGLPSWLGGLALAFCVSGFCLMAAALFRHETACGLFIFAAAVCMLTASGGLLPPPFLPRALYGLRYAAIPYWAVAAGGGDWAGVGALVGMGCAFVGAACAVEGARA